eukprot:TRINITY_DN20089_c0_g1_i1.p1 TRINITY_DN20089_c0_g1~~TRINITY_DN20089_c0_g1_i1.p1  ORF type:complete len:341 (-),score=85.06 TRINITY_DN20089_c0_g1_i1:15-1037(-)
MSLVQVKSAAEFSSIASNGRVIAALFSAEWAAPCRAVSQLLSALVSSHTNLTLVEIDSEGASEITEKYAVTSVPTVVFIANGTALDRVEGVNPSLLAQKLAKINSDAPTIAAAQQIQRATPQTVDPAAEAKALHARLEQLVNKEPVMLFMKGEPQAPRCGFSRKIVDLLELNGIKYGSFDILEDNQVREGLRTFSNWPTYPQLYVKGELIGGLDIVQEMHESGELIPVIPPEATKAYAKSQLEARLKTLISREPTMLFMKGSPERPQCKFSRKILEILRSANVTFGTFDILLDEEVRQGLKELSNWPTYPQLYHKGELVGGVDIVEEMANDGSLAETLSQ